MRSNAVRRSGTDNSSAAVQREEHDEADDAVAQRARLRCHHVACLDERALVLGLTPLLGCIPLRERAAGAGRVRLTGDGLLP